ncbi:MAG: protein kinase [Vicinamibacteria bacterium]
MSIATEPKDDRPTGRTTRQSFSTTAANRLAQLPSVIEPEIPRGPGLATRLFLGAAALLVLTLGSAIALASWRASRIAEEKIRADLQKVPAIWEGYRDSQGTAKRVQMRSLAEEPGSKALLAEQGVTPETFRDTGSDFAENLHASAVFFFDAEGLLIARSDRPAGDQAGRDFSGVSWVKEPLAERKESSAYILELSSGRLLSLVASAPVVQGLAGEQMLNGVIAAAFPVDRERANELARITASEVAFLGNVAPREQAPRPESVASTDALRGPDAAAAVAVTPGAVDAVFREGRPFGPFELTLAGETFLGTLIPIRSGSGDPIAAVLVARSKQTELAAFQRIREGLLVLGGVILLVSIPLSFFLARGLARPIRELAAAADAVGRGELDAPLPAAGGGEVGALTRAFATMVDELRAKGELERLVADLQRRPGDVTQGTDFPVLVFESGLGIGETFAGRYTVLSKLGEGGMGQVFRVRDNELDDEVALKTLKPEAHDATQMERLRQEIKLARLITHPNVVRVHDFGESDGQRFLTMEYVPGTTLREMLDVGRRLEMTPALQLAKQICRGLAAVHKAGIVHGDLKPQNVMVMGNGVVKLMDFGVARQRLQREQSIGTSAGTPLYMSPEQARGGELDERSDIYSAGVVMFELFTGSVPFTDRDIYEIMRMHLNEPAPNPKALRPDMPEGLAHLILTCLAKSRLQRPATAGDLDRLLMRVHA